VFAALHASDVIALGAGVVAALSFFVAMWSVTVARGANTISEGSNALAQESNDIARAALQHNARGVELAESVEADRKRQEQARAEMQADLSPLFASSQTSMMYFRPLVRVWNVGTRDSGRTVVRVYMRVGESADLMAWDDEHTRNDRTRPIVEPDAKFYDPRNGTELPAQYLERVVDNVTPTMPVELRVMLPVSIPPEGHGRSRLPVRVTVRAEKAEAPFEWTDYLNVEYGPPPR
jgi:hypothetical protein